MVRKNMHSSPTSKVGVSCEHLMNIDVFTVTCMKCAAICTALFICLLLAGEYAPAKTRKAADKLVCPWFIIGLTFMMVGMSFSVVFGFWRVHI